MNSREEFQTIDSDSALAGFVRKHGFVKAPATTAEDVLGVYVGEIDGVRATITHSWRDPSGPFENKPDIHKVRLEVDGTGTRNIAYEG